MSLKTSNRPKMSQVKLTKPRWQVTFTMAVVILTLLPYSSTLSLPSGDPAPGRSPGPPVEVESQTESVKLTEETDTVNSDIEYEETTLNEVDMTTEVSEVSSASDAVLDACAFARVRSDDDVVMLDVADSDVNLTVTHPVFEAEELVRGVVYEVLIYPSNPQLTPEVGPILDPMDEKIFSLNVDEMVRKFVRPVDKRVPRPPRFPNQQQIQDGLDVGMPENMTRETLKKRRVLLETEMIVKSKDGGVPNFGNHEDDINVPTRRFDSLNKGHPMLSRREYYWNELEYQKKPVAKEKLLDLMAHFIYYTRYNLPYSQTLRNKYRETTLYQIGYCFNVLRRLKIEQMVIFSTMRILMFDYVNLAPHIKLYQKVVNLDVDINDMIKLINELNERRVKEIEHQYGWEQGLLQI